MSQTDQKSFEKVNRRAFTGTHLIGIEDLSPDEINIILDLADYYAERLDEREFKPDILRNQIVLTLFFEDSTRTRTSFEVAAKRLGADVVNIDLRTSSINKGESLLDTIRTLNSMLRPDAIIVRHSEFGAPHFISTIVDCPVINAGDSWNEHPTQALLDALTIRRAFGKIDGLTVAIIGDIAHSRVASSNMKLLTKMGAHVRIIAPPVLMPEKLPADNIKQFNSLEDGLKGADIAMTIRPQKERMEKALIEDDSYFSEFGLTKEKLSWAKKDAVVLDPGPFLRNVQISDDLADDPNKFLYLKQVRNGVPTRMAVLDILMKGRFS